VTEETTSVLVVDDDPSLTDLLVDTLAIIGYQAFPASSAMAALKIISSEKINLVISDINMPEMSGIELLQEIKKVNQQMPVMLITGIGSDAIKDRAYLSGADSFLAKPFRISTMESEIGKLLSGIKRRKVAVIDDNEEFLKSLGQRLELSDNIVYLFKTISAASKFLNIHSVDLVITDLKMPDGDGLSLFSQLHARFPSLPVIMISAYATDDVIQRINDSGIREFLPKPIRFEDLESVLTTCSDTST
jgi:DNA-binding NtrC family response regulator